jgi:hypothetical protein
MSGVSGQGLGGESPLLEQHWVQCDLSRFLSPGSKGVVGFVEVYIYQRVGKFFRDNGIYRVLWEAPGMAKKK